MMPYSVASSCDFFDYIYIANLVDELPLNMTSRLDLQRIICTELAGVEKFRFEEDSGEVWLTAFVKFCSKEAAEEAIQILNAHEKIGAATISSLLEQYSRLEDSLRSHYSGYCTFSFIVVEQVNLSISQSDMISLFTNYGPVKIAKTAPPMCIGYERFTEALVAKIDQNRWNNDSAYISVKIFPRMKEQVLGFLKARMSHHVPNSDPNVLDPFSVCLICDRNVQPYTYQEIDVSKSNTGNICNKNKKPIAQESDASDSVGDDYADTLPESKGNCKLNFDPNDFLFYLRIESKALSNLNKQTLYDSSPSDTGISSDISTRTMSGSESGNDVTRSPCDSLNECFSQISLDETSLSELPNLTLQNQDGLDSENPTVLNSDYNEPPTSYTYEENVSGAEGQNEDLMNDYIYPQWPYGYIYLNQAGEIQEQCPFDSSAANHEYLYPCYDSSSTASQSSFSSSEIEKNFNVYGMKMSSRHFEDDPKIILIPFVYYPGRENSYWCTPRTKDKIAHHSTRNSPEFRMKYSSGTPSTQTVAKSEISVEVPVLNDKNFPTLQEVKSTSTTAKSRYHSKKCTNHQEYEKDSFVKPPIDPLENKLKIGNDRTLHNHTSFVGRNKNVRTRSNDFKGSHNSKQELPQNKTLGSSCGIKLVFSNKSRSAARCGNQFPNQGYSRNLTDRFPRTTPSHSRRGRSLEHMAYYGSKGNFRRTEKQNSNSFDFPQPTRAATFENTTINPSSSRSDIHVL